MTTSDGFCAANRHKNEISWCLFVEISKCHANINKMHAQVEYKNTIIQRKRNTRHGISVFGAYEEQGYKTLHRHWQIWVQELNQTLRDCLFDTDATKRKKRTKNILPTYQQSY